MLTYLSIPLSSLQATLSTALIQASDQGHTVVVEALLEAPGIDFNLANVSVEIRIPHQLVVVGRLLK